MLFNVNLRKNEFLKKIKAVHNINISFTWVAIFLQALNLYPGKINTFFSSDIISWLWILGQERSFSNLLVSDDFYEVKSFVQVVHVCVGRKIYDNQVGLERKGIERLILNITISAHVLITKRFQNWGNMTEGICCSR